MEGRAPTEFTLKEKTEFIVQGVLSGKIFDFAKPANVSLWKELSGYFARPEVKAKLAAQMDKVSEPERRTFLMANMIPAGPPPAMTQRVCSFSTTDSTDKQPIIMSF